MERFSREIVDELADKLLIGLSKEENEMVLVEFDAIDKNLNLINDIPNIESVIPMTHCLDDFTYELREDEIDDEITLDEALQNCDDYIDSEVRVPKVVG